MEFILGTLSVLLAILALLWSHDLSKRTDALIQSEDKRVKELLAKMDERAMEQSRILAKMDERAERQSQILERQNEMLERMEETQRYVAELVRIEGEKLRSLISH
ncbi:MAG: hypothetical protein Fur0020_14060 [Thermodesulfovibrionia bacterium]